MKSTYTGDAFYVSYADSAHPAGQASRRRGCHLDHTPLFIAIGTPDIKVHGVGWGGIKMTVSLTARRGCLPGVAARQL